MLRIWCPGGSAIMTLTHERGGPLCAHIQALTLNRCMFTLENYRARCEPLVTPVCLNRVCTWRRSLAVIVWSVWIFSFALGDKYNKDYEVCSCMYCRLTRLEFHYMFRQQLRHITVQKSNYTPSLTAIWKKKQKTLLECSRTSYDLLLLAEK